MFAMRRPEQIEPILPLLSRELPRGKGWCYELKLDGFRGTLYLGGGDAHFRSKKKHPMPRFAELAARVAGELRGAEAILDGEIVVMGAHGPQFNALMFNRGVPQFAAFDLLWLNGRDLRAEPYERRKAALRRLVQRRKWIAEVESHPDPALFDLTVRLDLEGVVAKRRGDPYGVATQWVKVKNRGYSQAVGRWKLFEGR